MIAVIGFAAVSSFAIFCLWCCLRASTLSERESSDAEQMKWLKQRREKEGGS